MAYDLELEIKEVLEKINFVERYKALSEKFSNSENTFENYENEKAIEVFESLGYKAVYNKKQTFYCRRSKTKMSTPLDSTSA